MYTHSSSTQATKLKLTVRETVIFGLLTAIVLVSQIALSSVANVELVSLFLIIYTKRFKNKTLYIIYTFVLFQGIIYGFGLWFISYLYIWALLFLVVRVIKVEGAVFYAIISGTFGLLFGTLTSIATLFLYGPTATLGYIIAGIPFDLLHGVANFAVTLILYEPISRIVNRIK